MKRKQGKSRSILECFIGNHVIVDTYVEPVTGVLVDFWQSLHSGIGNLLLSKEQGRWVLVKT
ncbi:MAG: hypothetical protein QXQ94_10705 [Candidatus Bathyarchaeia archaeon]